MYSLYKFGTMIADSVRIHAFEKALKSTIRPGMTVLDLGAGTGVLSLLACRFGATKVHAVELADSVFIGREMAEANGFSDRIVWHHQSSFDLTLEEPVDLIVADLRGLLPFHRGSIRTIIDARDRLLKPDGIMISQRDRCHIALAEAPDLAERSMHPWGANDFDFDLGPIRSRLINEWIFAPVRADRIISEDKLWCAIDYQTVNEVDVENELSFSVLRDGVVHGFFVWFDTDLTKSVGFSAGPNGLSPEVYGSGFFPFPEPVTVKKGDVAVIHLTAKDMGTEYLWRWRSNLGGCHFDQSTFFSLPLNSEILNRSKMKHLKESNDSAQV